MIAKRDKRPTADAGDLLARVRALELAARRNAAGRLEGRWATSIKGRGLLFEEPRRYVPGDSVRRIDWNITARVAEPHVRVHREERQRRVLLLVDVSPSMHFGTRRCTKLELAVELAATLAVSAVEAGDRVGYVTFADRVLSDSRPRGGRAQLFRTLRALLDATGEWRRTVELSDPRAAIHRAESYGGGAMSIFVLSDFLDEDIARDLAYLRPRHEVSLLGLFDPLELELPAAPRLLTRAAEGGRRVVQRSVQRARTTELARHHEAVRLSAARRGIAWVTASTAESVDQVMLRLLRVPR